MPQNRRLVDKPIGIQIIKRFPAFYTTQIFMTMVTIAHHWNVSGVSWDTSTVDLLPRKASGFFQLMKYSVVLKWKVYTGQPGYFIDYHRHLCHYHQQNSATEKDSINLCSLWRTCFGRGYGPVVRQTTE
jgi:hypothetical protein